MRNRLSLSAPRRGGVALTLLCLHATACATWAPVPVRPPRTEDRVVFRVHRVDGSEVTLQGEVVFAEDEIRGTGVEELCVPSMDRTRTVCADHRTPMAIPLTEVERVESMDQSGRETVATAFGIAIVLLGVLVYAVWDLFREWDRGY